jgi:hypothetical protein
MSRKKCTIDKKSFFADGYLQRASSAARASAKIAADSPRPTVVPVETRFIRAEFIRLPLTPPPTSATRSAPLQGRQTACWCQVTARPVVHRWCQVTKKPPFRDRYSLSLPEYRDTRAIRFGDGTA